MGNMSYCRFRNTVMDLYDCKDVLDTDGLTGKNEHDERLSHDEFKSAIELIELAREIAEQFEGVHLWEVTDEFKTKKREEI